MHGLTWSELNYCACQDLYCLWAACPCLSWSAVAMCALSSFLGLPSRRRCALAVALHRRDSGLDPLHARNYIQSSWNIYMRLFKIYGIWPQTDKHTHNFRKCSHASVGNAVMLVWGSLRLAPKSSFVHNSGKRTQRQAPATHILTHVDNGGQPSVLKNKLRTCLHMLTHMPTIKLDLLGGWK